MAAHRLISEWNASRARRFSSPLSRAISEISLRRKEFFPDCRSRTRWSASTRPRASVLSITYRPRIEDGDCSWNNRANSSTFEAKLSPHEAHLCAPGGLAALHRGQVCASGARQARHCSASSGFT